MKALILLAAVCGNTEACSPEESAKALRCHCDPLLAEAREAGHITTVGGIGYITVPGCAPSTFTCRQAYRNSPWVLQPDNADCVPAEPGTDEGWGAALLLLLL